MAVFYIVSVSCGLQVIPRFYLQCWFLILSSSSSLGDCVPRSLQPVRPLLKPNTVLIPPPPSTPPCVGHFGTPASGTLITYPSFSKRGAELMHFLGWVLMFFLCFYFCFFKFTFSHNTSRTEPFCSCFLCFSSRVKNVRKDNVKLKKVHVIYWQILPGWTSGSSCS